MKYIKYMPIEDRQIIKHFRTTGTTAPVASAITDGEIALSMDNTNPKIFFKKNNGDMATFVDKEYVDGLGPQVQINSSDTNANYPILAASSSSITDGNNYTAIYDTGFKINPVKHAVQEGDGTTASGYASHAEGDSTIASGDQSHAEGSGASIAINNEFSWTNRSTTLTAPNNTDFSSIKVGSVIEYINSSNIRELRIVDSISTTNNTISISRAFSEAGSSRTLSIIKGIAYGGNSHAEGYDTTALGEESHAEGYDTTASGDSSHAEGESTTASGYASHAEGNSTIASVDNSHAEGDGTTASGYASHAEGDSTIAQNKSEHAEGRYNVSHKASNLYGNSGNTQHSIGIGTSSDDTNNAIEVMQNGDVYVNGIGNYDGSHIESATTLQNVINDLIPSKIPTMSLCFKQKTSISFNDTSIVCHPMAIKLTDGDITDDLYILVGRNKRTHNPNGTKRRISYYCAPTKCPDDVASATPLLVKDLEDYALGKWLTLDYNSLDVMLQGFNWNYLNNTDLLVNYFWAGFDSKTLDGEKVEHEGTPLRITGGNKGNAYSHTFYLTIARAEYIQHDVGDGYSLKILEYGNTIPFNLRIMTDKTCNPDAEDPRLVVRGNIGTKTQMNVTNQ